jgi:hypothetical protein
MLTLAFFMFEVSDCCVSEAFLGFRKAMASWGSRKCNEAGIQVSIYGGIKCEIRALDIYTETLVVATGLALVMLKRGILSLNSLSFINWNPQYFWNWLGGNNMCFVAPVWGLLFTWIYLTFWNQPILFASDNKNTIGSNVWWKRNGNIFAAAWNYRGELRERVNHFRNDNPRGSSITSLHLLNEEAVSLVIHIIFQNSSKFDYYYYSYYLMFVYLLIYLFIYSIYIFLLTFPAHVCLWWGRCPNLAGSTH